MDFGIGLVNPVHNFPSLSIFTGCPLRPKKLAPATLYTGQTCLMGKWIVLRYSNYRRTAKSVFAYQKVFGAILVEMMFRLVNASFSLPKWQAVKMTFFAPCVYLNMHISSVRSGAFFVRSLTWDPSLYIWNNEGMWYMLYSPQMPNQIKKWIT